MKKPLKISHIVAKIGLHLLPLLPLYLGYYWLTLAAVLLIINVYVKVFKLRQQIESIHARAKGVAPIPSLEKALKFWTALTFLAEIDK